MSVGGERYVGSDGVGRVVRRASKNDTSPVHVTPYAWDCACCWLNIAHSQELHERALQGVTPA